MMYAYYELLKKPFTMSPFYSETTSDLTNVLVRSDDYNKFWERAHDFQLSSDKYIIRKVLCSAELPIVGMNN